MPWWKELFVPESPLGLVAVRALFAYLVVLVLFRIFGRSLLSRHSSFDLAVMFLVGASLRLTVVGEDASVTAAAVGLFTLFAADRAVAELTYRSRTASLIIEGGKIEIVRDGRPVRQGLRRARMDEAELHQHLRGEGEEDLGKVKHAFLERDGSVSFVMK